MNALKMRYGEAHRQYHVWLHIESMLRLMAWCDRALYNREAVELAVLFHDAVYESGADDNEQRSAGLMHGMLSKLVAPVSLNAAQQLILATEKHVLPDGMVDPLRSDCAYFLDMDLAILGSTPDVFDAFQGAIREEFSDVPDDLYRAGRKAVLERFLARNTLYLTEMFRDAFDAQARSNLIRAIAEL